ncbi:hypothetical protein ACWFQ8_06925 [Streptomyces sp. NPDC055254]
MEPRLPVNAFAGHTGFLGGAAGAFVPPAPATSTTQAKPPSTLKAGGGFVVCVGSRAR